MVISALVESVVMAVNEPEILKDADLPVFRLSVFALFATTKPVELIAVPTEMFTTTSW